MSKTKKRSLKRISKHSPLTPTNQTYRRAGPQIEETPDRTFDHREHSDKPSSSSGLDDGNGMNDTGGLQQSYSIDKRYSMPPPATIPPQKKRKREGSQAINPDQERLHSTPIVLPSDPWRSRNFANNIQEQNRRRHSHPQTFTASIPQYSDTDEEGSISIKESIASPNGLPDIQFARDEDETDEYESNDNDASTSTEKKSSVPEEDDSEEEDDSTSPYRNRSKYSTSSDSSTSSNDSTPSPSAKRPKLGPDKLKTERALIGADAIETMREKKIKKAEMEKAAKRAIKTLTLSHTQQPEPPPLSHSTTLSKSELRALKSLKSIIPPLVLANIQASLSLSKSSSNPRKDKDQDKDKDTTTPSTPEPSDLETSLIAARSLIIGLSARRLGITPSGAVSNSNSGSAHGNGHGNRNTHIQNHAHAFAHAHNSDAQMQRELIRIIRDRESDITELEWEVSELREEGWIETD